VLTRLNLSNLLTIGTAGDPEDLFEFDDNAKSNIIPTQERILIALPATPAQVFGRVRIRENGRMSDALATSFAAQLSGTGVTVSGNTE
jgi:hypothetical protein